MLVTLILATVGRVDEVGRCLHSLVKQTDSNFEVLLVDQNSDDRLVPWVKEMQSIGLNLRHIRMEVPSLSGARNMGIASATGEIIGFTDDDCWYDLEAIEHIRIAFSDQASIDGVIANWVEQSEAHKMILNEDFLSNDAWRGFRGGDASSISIFMKRKLVNDLQGFDERLGIGRWFGAGEETDLILRALAGKAKLLRLPSAKVHHLFGVASSAPRVQHYKNMRCRARGTGALYAKHRLGIITILRGFVAPVIKPLLSLQGINAIIIGFWVAIGRIEGFLHWGWGKP